MHILIILSAIVFVLIPAFFLSSSQGVLAFLIALVGQALVALIIANIFLLARRLKLVALVAAVYYVLVYLIIAYRIVTGAWFDAYYVLDSRNEALETLVQTIGIHGVIGVVLGCLAAGLLLFVLIRSLFRRATNIHARKKYLILTLISAIIAYILVPSQLDYLQYQVSHFVTVGNMREEVKMVASNMEINAELNGENIIILQLESLNAIALNGLMVTEEGTYDGNYIPYMRKVGEDGTFFKFFYANSIQTNRAQASLLCGIVGNLDVGFSHRPDEITVKCLPDILNDAGYTTALFRSDRLSFANTEEFMTKIGIKEIHYQDIMQEDDLHRGWGYDDCVFYDRTFEYLKTTYPAPSGLFAYVEVSTNHNPFPAFEEYAFTHAFPQPKNFLETYLNAALQQDYCVSRFYEDYLEYAPKNTHLFIISDTSWPVGINGSRHNELGVTNDNFMYPAVYVPPSDSREQYSTGAVSTDPYAQNDIIPTILELLSGKAQQNAFTFALRTDGTSWDTQVQDSGRGLPPYEDCHILTQPYGGGVVVVLKGDKKFVYYVSEGILEERDRWDLLDATPLLTNVLSMDMPYEEFRDKYYCERYKNSFSGDLDLPDEPMEM